jgi:hypothetical protein
MNIDRTLFAAEIKAQNDPFPSSAGFIVSNSMHGSSISTKPFCLASTGCVAEVLSNMLDGYASTICGPRAPALVGLS